MRTAFLFLLLAMPLFLFACKSAEGPETAIATARAGDLTATLSNQKGTLREGDNDFTLELKNAAGQPVDAGAITLFFEMPAMANMAYMKNDARLTMTDRPGVYRGTVKLDMKSSWQGRLSFKGPNGEGQASFSVNVK